MTEPSRPEWKSDPRPSFLRGVPRLFGRMEELVAVGTGILLAGAAFLALAGALSLVWDALVQWPQLRSVFRIVDRLLLVLMIIEILHTVRTSIESHQLSAEPFLVVGLIATIRRILVVTFEISDRAAGGETTAGIMLPFDHAMIELGVLGGLTLVLAVAILMVRRGRTPS